MPSQPHPLSVARSVTRLIIMLGLISSLLGSALLATSSAIAATPATGVMTPLIRNTYAVNASSSIGGICALCSINDVGFVTDTSTTNAAHIFLPVGIGTSGTIAVEDTTNTYAAGYFAGFVVDDAGIVNVQVLNGITIRTYNNGVLQESSTSGTILNASLFLGTNQTVIGFVTTKAFDEIRITASSLVGVLVNLDVYYAVVQSAPPVPGITAPTAGSTTTTIPTISGSGVAGSTITVKEGASTLCSATVAANGNWNCTPASALSQGSHTITATATNLAGSSAASPAVSFTVDTIAPPAPVFLTPAEGTRINTATPTITGTAEANSTVQLKEGGVTVCTTTANGSGAWSCPLTTPLSDGSHSLTATATDAGGNTSVAATARTFIVDTTAPVAPTISSPPNSGIINTAIPTIAGTAEPGSIVTVKDGSTTICTVTATVGGSWSCVPASALAEGSHTLNVTATDSAGNTSATASSIFTINTAAVSTPSILVPAANTSISDTTPTISGTADPNTTVSVYEGAILLCTAATGPIGEWNCTPAALAEGSHTLTVSATNTAGTTSSTATSSFTIDTTAPAAPGITSPASGAIVATGQPIISGAAETGSTVIVSEGSTTLCTATTSAGSTWSCSPTTGLNDGNHSITATATDIAGNTGSASASRSFIVDTTVPAAPSITAPAASASINNSNPLISGTAEAGSTVIVKDGSIQICTTLADANGDWSCTPSTPLNAGSHTLTATAIDPAGNTGSVSAPVSFTIDFAAPAAPSISSPASGSATNDTTPAFTGTAEAGSQVRVKEGGNTLCTATTDQNGDWICTPSTPLSNGTYTITASATDAAGNIGADSAPVVLQIDTQAPAAPVVSSPPNAGAINTTTPIFAGTAEAGSSVTVSEQGQPICTATADANGNWNCAALTPLTAGAHTIDVRATDAAGNVSTPGSSTFTIDLSTISTPSILVPAPLAAVNSAQPIISGTADPNATVAVRENGQDICTTTADAGGTWSCTPTTPLVDGNHTIQVTATNAAGTPSSPASRTFTIDLTAPTGAPGITSPADGARLNSATPTFSGTGAEAGSTVSVREGATIICTGVAGAGGDWSCTPNSLLSDSSHTFTAVAIDPAGNSGPASTPITIEIDTAKPAAPMISAPQAGEILSSATPAISGSAEAGSTVVVSEGAAVLCTTTAASNTTWSCSPATPMSEGAHAITATATDTTGNSSEASPLHSFTIDQTAPAAPTISSPTEGAATNITTPALAGTAAAGSIVTVSENGSTLCTATAHIDGSWTCAPVTALASGSHNVTAVARDAAGNTSTPSPVRSFTIDTTAPAAPAISTPGAGTITNNTRPVIGGTAEAGTTVTVQENNTTICTAVVPGSGDWSCTPAAAFGEGSHTITAIATDAAINTGVGSAPRSFTIDTSAPAAPVLASPATGGTINTTLPAISGTAEPGSTVTVSEGSTELCSSIVDGSGNWSCTPGTPFSVGAHTINAVAADTAGNISGSAASAFTIDTAAVSTPSITIPAANAVVNSNRPAITGTADSGTTVTVTESGNQVCTATTTAQGTWICTPGADLSEGSHTIDAVANAGATTSTPATRSFTVDTVAPASTPTIVSPAEGNSTSDTTPSFSGTGGESGGLVRVADGATLICLATVMANSEWSCVATTPLAQGSRTVTATNIDAAGNTGQASAPRGFSIDTLAPVAPAIASPTAGTQTSDPTPSIAGTTEPGATVVVREGATVLCTAIADSNGNWSCTPSTPLGEGLHAITATATDPSGNTGSASPLSTFTIDTATPLAPTLATPGEGSDIDDATPTFSGTAEPGSTVAVRDGSTLLCTATADQQGNWSCTPTVPLTSGPHTVTITATDSAGNISTPQSRTFTVQPAAVSAPVVLSPTEGQHITDTTPAISGTAGPGVTISVYEGAILLCSTTSDANGNWSCVPSAELAVGSHTVTVTATDSQNNISNGTTRTFVIDSESSTNAAIIVTQTAPLQVSEGGAGTSFTVGLATTPSAPVTITFGANADVQIQPQSLTFTPANATVPQTVTLEAVDDTLEEGAEQTAVQYSITSTDPAYVALQPAPIAVTVIDNDTTTQIRVFLPLIVR